MKYFLVLLSLFSFSFTLSAEKNPITKMKIFIFVIGFSITFLSIPTYSQQCGPGCPACSGKTTGALLPEYTIFGSGLYIPDGEEETAVFNMRYGVFSWMDVGIGYALDAEEEIWSVRFEPISQDFSGWRPALIIGTGSLQTGGSDQSIYAQLVKTWEIVEGVFGLSLAGGYATDLPDLNEKWGVGTASFTLFDRVSPFYTYDGINSHAGLSVFITEWLTLSGYALEMKDIAVMVGFQWRFGQEEDGADIFVNKDDSENDSEK